MHFKIIEELKRAEPKKRQTILMRMREKNLRHLRKWVPELANYLETTGTGRFEVRIDKHFLQIIDRTTGQPCHPPNELLPYMQQLGYRYHTGWIEKNAIAPIPRGGSEHGQILIKFRNRLFEALPALPERIVKGEVRLPSLGNERGYSGPTVFLGVFSGFHVMNYLSRNDVQDAFLIEPDLDRFALSCFFLDYEALHENWGHLLLHVGLEMPQNPVDLLIHSSPVTASAWIRLLPAYPDGKFDEIVSRVALRWASLNQIFVPFDREVRNLSYAMKNLQSAAPLMKAAPTLSSGSTIAVVASGPSLSQDMEWLKRNQDKLIIFSATSTVRALRHNGVRVDFQFALDTEIGQEDLEQLQLDHDAPMVGYYKMNPELVAKFSRPLLVVEKFKANPARIEHMLTGTHPTTGNLAAALAAWVKPAQMLLIGLDLGYRDARESHVKDTIYDDNDGALHVVETAGKETQAVAANFKESEGQIVTHAYHNNARLSLESVCARMVEAGVRILNLSDGAFINGATPQRSSELELADYPQRDDDIAAILNAFSSDHEDMWEPYEIPGTERLAQLREALLGPFEQIDTRRFDWIKWAGKLDNAWRYAASKAAGPSDARIECYARLIFDLLSEWYRAALLTHETAETLTVFNAGLEALREALEALTWPEDLD